MPVTQLFRIVVPAIVLLCGSSLKQLFADDALPGEFRWTMSEPLVEAQPTDGLPWHAIKDPSIVRFEGRWHLFATMRGTERSHTTVYLSFADWDQASAAPRNLLPCHDGYFCAPQVFWYAPHRKWYLVCQGADDAWGTPPYRPAFSTTDQISDVKSWSPLQPMFDHKPANIPGWIDFWVICDDARAWLFFTSNNGQMWRCHTSHQSFPRNWSEPELALEADIFEANHIYRVAGRDQYLNIVEAQNGDGWRYYKAWVADSLGGEWKPLASTRANPFASMKNVKHPASRWTDSISHGELIRAGHDERLEIDPDHLQLVFQGVLDSQRGTGGYGAIPWRLGILTLTMP